QNQDSPTLGQLRNFVLEFGRRNRRSLQPSRCTVIRPIWHQIQPIIDHGSMTREHDEGQVLARTASHVALHCRQRIENSALGRGLVGQKLWYYPSIKTTL